MKSNPNIDLIHHISQTNQLSPTQAERILQEFLAFFNETLEQFVQRRHRELQQSGLKNQEIFEIIQSELAYKRFSQPGVSARQLRRQIYG